MEAADSLVRASAHVSPEILTVTGALQDYGSSCSTAHTEIREAQLDLCVGKIECHILPITKTFSSEKLLKIILNLIFNGF